MPFFNLGINTYTINYELIVTSKNNNYRHVERLAKKYRAINGKRATEMFKEEIDNHIKEGKKNNPNATAKYNILSITEEA